MSAQESLFDAALKAQHPARKVENVWSRALGEKPPMQRESDTSRHAATLIVPHMPAQRQRVYDWLVVNGPATDEEISEGLNMNPSSVRPRRLELEQAGLVVESLPSRTTKSGRRASAWKAK